MSDTSTDDMRAALQVLRERITQRRSEAVWRGATGDAAAEQAARDDAERLSRAVRVIEDACGIHHSR